MSLPDSTESRNEQYLSYIATGKGMLPETPESRIEQYLAYIAENKSGVKDVTETVVVESHTSTTSVVEGFDNPYVSEDKWLVPNKKYEYKVIYDGTEYTCYGFRWFNYVDGFGSKVTRCLGDIRLLGEETKGYMEGELINVPFLIVEDRLDDGKSEVFTTEAGEHTFKIIEVKKTIVEIPGELIYGGKDIPIHYSSPGASKFSKLSIGGPNDMQHDEGTIAIGFGNIVSGQFAVAIGTGNESSGKCGVSFGTLTKAEGFCSTVMGNSGTAHGSQSVAGGYNCYTDGNSSIALGYSNEATKDVACAINRENKANGLGSFACGYKNTANGNFSYVGGMQCETNANASMVHGWQCNSHGKYSISLGYGTDTNLNGQIVVGQYNNNQSTNEFEVGIGTGASDKKNGFAVTLTGDAKVKGSVYVGCNADSSGGIKLPPIPECPTSTDGAYVLKCTVASGTATYSWVKE